VIEAVAEDELGVRVATIAKSEHELVGNGTVAIVCAAGQVDNLNAQLTDAGVTFGEAIRRGLQRDITLVGVDMVKGLEFDAVVVVEPARIARDAGLRALYVALTRATKRLTVVHAEPLPEPLRIA
jgi:DNA helicase IV